MKRFYDCREKTYDSFLAIQLWGEIFMVFPSQIPATIVRDINGNSKRDMGKRIVSS